MLIVEFPFTSLCHFLLRSLALTNYDGDMNTILKADHLCGLNATSTQERVIIVRTRWTHKHVSGCAKTAVGAGAKPYPGRSTPPLRIIRLPRADDEFVVD